MDCLLPVTSMLVQCSYKGSEKNGNFIIEDIEFSVLLVLHFWIETIEPRSVSGGVLLVIVLGDVTSQY